VARRRRIVSRLIRIILEGGCVNRIERDIFSVALVFGEGGENTFSLSVLCEVGLVAFVGCESVSS